MNSTKKFSLLNEIPFLAVTVLTVKSKQTKAVLQINRKNSEEKAYNSRKFELTNKLEKNLLIMINFKI